MKKVGIVLVLMLVMLIGVGLVAAQGSNLPGSGWRSGQQIQNLGTSNAAVVFTAYNMQGAPTACGEKSVPPGGSANYLTDVDCPVAAGFVGSAVVSADQPIAAIVNVVNNPSGKAAGQYRGTDGADVASSIAFPLMKNNFRGRTTTFYVQNASSSVNNISATFKVGTQNFPLASRSVQANAMTVITPADAGVPAGSVGSLVVTGSQPIAGTVLEHEVNVPVGNNLLAATAFSPSEYDDVAFCPLVRNGHTRSDQTTGIQAQNVSGSAQAIRVRYVFSINGNPQPAKEVTSPVLQNGESFTFFAKDATYGMPAGSLGSARVSGVNGGNIAVIVNDVAFGVNPTRQTSYSCFADNGATTKIAMPLYKEFFRGNTTGIQVQNVSNNPATITLTYTGNNGQVVKLRNTSPVPAGASFTFYGVSGSPSGITIISGNPASLRGSFGGVVVESGQRIVAMANESNDPSAPSGLDAGNYEGFNQ